MQTFHPERLTKIVKLELHLMASFVPYIILSISSHDGLWYYNVNKVTLQTKLSYAVFIKGIIVLLMSVLISCREVISLYLYKTGSAVMGSI